jgi:hypothetical protein
LQFEKRMKGNLVFFSRKFLRFICSFENIVKVSETFFICISALSKIFLDFEIAFIIKGRNKLKKWRINNNKDSLSHYSK